MLTSFCSKKSLPLFFFVTWLESLICFEIPSVKNFHSIPQCACSDLPLAECMLHHKALGSLEINGEAEICFQMLSKNPQRKQIPCATLFLMVLHLNLKRRSAKFQVTCILPHFRWLKQMACLVILEICKYPCPSSNCILSLHPFKVKTTEELSFKKSHKGSLRKFCFEIGELFEMKYKN